MRDRFFVGKDCTEGFPNEKRKEDPEMHLGLKY